jgi:hypothetical protein
VDTIIIKEIIRQTLPIQEFGSNPVDMSEDLSILVRYPTNSAKMVTIDSNKHDPFIGGSILIMDNHIKEPEFTFWFKGVSYQAISKAFTLRSIDSLVPTTYQTKVGIFDDVLIFKTDTVYPDIFDRISKVYWSRHFGYVRVEINDTSSWELIKSSRLMK